MGPRPRLPPVRYVTAWRSIPTLQTAWSFKCLRVILWLLKSNMKELLSLEAVNSAPCLRPRVFAELHCPLYKQTCLAKGPRDWPGQLATASSPILDNAGKVCCVPHANAEMETRTKSLGSSPPALPGPCRLLWAVCISVPNPRAGCGVALMTACPMFGLS